jgi:hypothetical protein
VAGFDCKTGFVLPQGAVVATMGDPTVSAGDCTAIIKGTNGQYCNVSITAPSDAEEGTQTVTVEMTSSFGDGPVMLIGTVEVVSGDE